MQYLYWAIQTRWASEAPHMWAPVSYDVYRQLADLKVAMSNLSKKNITTIVSEETFNNFLLYFHKFFSFPQKTTSKYLSK